MNRRTFLTVCLLPAASCLLAAGCHSEPKTKAGPPYARPFPLGQVTDAPWDPQQTNAEAADFIFYDHEFEGATPRLTPAGRKHLLQIAVRLEHVPFPVVVEESPDRRNPELDQIRRKAIVAQLSELGLGGIDGRVVVAPAFARGISATEGEAAYYSSFHDNYDGGTGRAFGGRGGVYR